MGSLLLLVLQGCPAPTDSGVDMATEFSDCDPIAPDYCAFPFPSSFYLREDSATATGWRVHLGATTIPYTDQGEISYQPDPARWNELDGFSPLGPLLVQFDGMADANLVGHDRIGDSLVDGASVVILDWDSGERMPYFAELDYAGYSFDGERTLIIRPVVPLRNGHRYVVGVRGLVDASGAPLAASPAFAALRDGTATSDFDVEGRRAVYEEIFSRLEADGWDRGETLVAWDLVIKSTEAVAGKSLWMRDDARQRFGDGTGRYTLEPPTDEVNEQIFREIHGTMSVPYYTEGYDVGTLLSRDDSGMPSYQGDAEVPFTIRVPRTAVDDPRPLPLLQYGHGLLGDQGEVGGGYLGEVADRYGYVLFAVDWTGMKEEDSDAITEMLLRDLGNFAIIPERSQQGLVEAQAAAWLMGGALAADTALQIDGVSIVDPGTIYYYGNSQGGILGGAYLALSQDITRGTLGVPGMPYSLLLSRSSDFTPFFTLFQSVYDDQRSLVLWMSLLQQLWDAAEPAGFGRQVNEEPLADTPAKQILIQDAIGDAQVTTLGAHIMARSYDAALIDSPIVAPWGLVTEASGWTGSAIVEYDFGAPAVPTHNTPPDSDLDTHEDTRRAWAAQEQMAHFFATGEVVNYCEGACLCATGACDAP
jgi:hypothetical protein